MKDEKNYSKRICAIFLGNPLKLIGAEFLKIKTDANINTIWGILKRLKDRDIIRRIRPGLYKLNNYDKAMQYLENSTFVSDSPTPWDEENLPIPAVDHHIYYKIKLQNEIFYRLEYKFTKPHPNDPARNRTFEGNSFTLTISQSTLNGALYVKGTQWRSEIRKYFGDEFLQQCDQQEMHIGQSIDAEAWANFRLAQRDLQLMFATSHFWKELDIEGKQRMVNSLLQNICITGFDKTCLETLIVKILEELSERVDKIEGTQNLHLKFFQELIDIMKTKKLSIYKMDET